MCLPTYNPATNLSSAPPPPESPATPFPPDTMLAGAEWSKIRRVVGWWMVNIVSGARGSQREQKLNLCLLPGGRTRVPSSQILCSWNACSKNAGSVFLERRSSEAVFLERSVLCSKNAVLCSWNACSQNACSRSTQLRYGREAIMAVTTALLDRTLPALLDRRAP